MVSQHYLSGSCELLYNSFGLSYMYYAVRFSGFAQSCLKQRLISSEAPYMLRFLSHIFNGFYIK